MKLSASLLLAAILVAVACEGPDNRSTSSASSALPASLPSTGTLNRLSYEVDTILGSSNRNMKPRFRITPNGKTLTIQVAFNDNLTEHLIRVGMTMDLSNILKALHQSGYEYSKVTLSGSFPMADKFGNSSETEVVRASYSHTIVEKINWDGFQHDNVLDIADEVHLNRVL